MSSAQEEEGAAQDASEIPAWFAEWVDKGKKVTHMEGAFSANWPMMMVEIAGMDEVGPRSLAHCRPASMSGRTAHGVPACALGFCPISTRPVGWPAACSWDPLLWHS